MAVIQALQCGGRFFLLCHDPVCWGEQVVGWLHLKQSSQAEEKYQPHKDSGNTYTLHNPRTAFGHKFGVLALPCQPAPSSTMLPTKHVQRSVDS